MAGTLRAVRNGWEPYPLHATSGNTPFPILILVLLAVIAGVIWSYLAAKKRREMLRQFAFENGLEFTASPGDVHRKYQIFDPLDAGHSRSSQNLIHGRRGELDWEMFDYRYVTGSGKNRTTHRYGIAAARIPLALPPLTIRPENFLDRIAAAVGFDDIDFESDEFSRAYHVKCSNRKLAYDIIHPQMIEFLMGITRIEWQFAGNMVLLHRSGKYEPDELIHVMNLVGAFMERVPEFVRQDIGLSRRV